MYFLSVFSVAAMDLFYRDCANRRYFCRYLLSKVFVIGEFFIKQPYLLVNGNIKYVLAGIIHLMFIKQCITVYRGINEV